MTEAAAAPEVVRLAVRESGHGTEPLVLLHGFAASGFTWRSWVPALEERYRVFVVDLKGFGRSPKPRDGRYAPADQADAVCRVLDDHGLERVTLIGHSLGGGVALLTAIRLRRAGRLDRVRALVLVASAALPQALPKFIGLARMPALNVATLGSVPPRHLVRWVLRQIVRDPDRVTPEMVEGYARPLADSASRRALLDTARQIVPDDVSDIVGAYPSLDVPALLLWGEHDGVVPLWVGRRLADALPDARLVVLPECGHVPPEELPDASLAPVTAFLREVTGAP